MANRTHLQIHPLESRCLLSSSASEEPSNILKLAYAYSGAEWGVKIGLCIGIPVNIGLMITQSNNPYPIASMIFGHLPFIIYGGVGGFVIGGGYYELFIEGTEAAANQSQ